MQTERIYRYSPLHGIDAIRLVIVKPSAEISAPIRCSLLHTSLTNCENDIVDHYVALSYVWGEQKARRTIDVDGLSLDITSSLDEALRHIRDHHKPLKVWADGVSINQDDTEEKNKQVRLMGRIYENAAHTIIFLGLATPRTDSLMDMLKNLKPPQARAQNRSLLEQVKGFLKNEFENLIKDMLARPWFSRVWVLQELVLSSNPWIQCGTSRIKWDHFCDYLLPQSSPDERSKAVSGLLHPLSNMDEARARFRTIRSTRPQKHHPKHLWDLLTSRRGMGTADPRDMIYAHLGMVDIHTQNSITTDYDLPCSQIFEDVTVQFIRASKDLHVLRNVGNTGLVTRQKDLPSWVPDWSSPLLLGSISETSSWALRCSSPVFLFEDFVATLDFLIGEPACLTSNAIPHVLGVIGLCYGTIDTVEASHSTAIQQKNTLGSQVQRNDLHDKKNQKRQYQHDNNDTLEIMARFGKLMLKNINRFLRESGRPVEKDLSLFLEAMAPPMWLDRLGEGHESIFSRNIRYHGSAKTKHERTLGTVLISLYQASSVYFEGGTIAFLDDGGMMVVPSSTRDGDVICTIAGTGSECFILRPVTELIDPQVDRVMLEDMKREEILARPQDPHHISSFLSKIGHFEFVSPIAHVGQWWGDMARLAQLRQREPWILEAFALH